jgi:hypothetical protein
VVNATPRPVYPRERDPVPIVYQAGWAPVPVWTKAENLTPTGIRFPDAPARTESLYRLRCPGPRFRSRWKDNAEPDLEETGYISVDHINSAKPRVCWRPLWTRQRTVGFHERRTSWPQASEATDASRAPQTQPLQTVLLQTPDKIHKPSNTKSRNGER